MSARKKSRLTYLGIIFYLLPLIAFPASNTSITHSTYPHEANPLINTLAQHTIAKELGWVESTENYCGGYYVEPSFDYPVNVQKNNTSVEITSNQTLFSQVGTSILEGKVTVTRFGQQITANKAYLYRDPTTGKLSVMEMIGDVNLREPNTLIVGKKGRYNFDTQTKSLMDILYRTSLNGREVVGPRVVAASEMMQERRVTGLTAWGKAYEFSSTEPKIYELTRASFTTCPPNEPVWRVKASHIVLNKNTGRGYATNARILVRDIPIFYFPYINFSIDKQRKTGFLWPTVGRSNKWGAYFLAPFYWNMAPNYDMTITPGLLWKRGLQLGDKFRYLTSTSDGNFNFSVVPHDREFQVFQQKQQSEFGASASPIVQAELNRLTNASMTRKSASWRDDSRYNEHWSSHVDVNYAGDDYYLTDFGSNLNEITQNQLLQEGDLNYQSTNWNFIGRIQAYQTLHPIGDNQVQVLNQYRRLPQLVLNADYPDQAYGLEYFINNEATHFDILKNPGIDTLLPVGNRLNVQPGISLPLSSTYFFLNPRLQLALTDYNLQQTTPTATPVSIHRSVPIFDVASGLTFDRNFSFFGHALQQTLEPQVYYTYIPYRNQSSIPVFDTTVNTLTYDQLFNYNRFTGIDRIGDANQLGIGITTRFVEEASGLEKVRLGVGNIIYFANRRVTLCNSPAVCADYPDNPNNHYRLSPISGLLSYNVDPAWSFSANSIWNPISKQLDNSVLGFHYEPDEKHIVNLAYSFVHNGDILTGVTDANSSANNLKLTDFSFAWPVTENVSAVGRWSHDWNLNRLQNLLYGLQYDSCCWAVRLVGGRAFTGLDPLNNSRLLYNTEFYVQFSLKGLGNIGTGNPNTLLSSINGYNTQFGQEL